MTPVFDNNIIQLHLSDARQLPIPDESVDCVVTSPPYWGLRDYGLGGWVGGNADCDHVADSSATKTMGNPLFNENRPSREGTKTKGYYADICPKCGAVREGEGIGLEATPDEYCANMVAVFREVWRVLKPTGTVWLNLGDSYASSRPMGTSNNELGSYAKHINDIGVTSTIGDNEYRRRGKIVAGLKPKDLVGIPWRVAFALQADGWYLRSDIIWSKPNPMPESVQDRPTKAHEYIFLLTKRPKYYYDADAIREKSVWADRDARADGTGKHLSAGKSTSGQYKTNGVSYGIPDATGQFNRNKRSVWEINTQGYPEAHFATYPEKLVEPCIMAGCPLGGVVLDPFVGSGTTMAVAQRLGRRGIGTDLNEEYLALASKRLRSISMPMNMGI